MFDPESITFVQRIVISCLLNTDSEQQPIDAAEVRTKARDILEKSEEQPISGVSEADVARALNGLVDKGLIEERSAGDKSPVGKGRPQYALDVDPDTIREELADDDVGSLLT